jgi:hypothetical protein
MYTKECKQCSKILPLDLYQRDISKKDNLRPECKECTKLNRKQRYNKTETRKRNLEKNFGPDALKIYNEHFENQKGLCAICGSSENGRYSHLSIDHCHSSGRIRGLLCNNCNRGIGLLRDKAELLRKAAEYLETH